MGSMPHKVYGPLYPFVLILWRVSEKRACPLSKPAFYLFPVLKKLL